MINILEETFETIEINGLQALFTNSRIDRNNVPEGIYAYDIRHNDDGDEFATVAKKVIVNHAGTIITKKEIPMTCSDYAPVKDYNFLGEEMTFQEWNNQ